jgi:hypothetical protein
MKKKKRGYKKTTRNYSERLNSLCSWGYEQTNINFYLVVERKKSTLVLQEIGQNRTYEHQDSGTCTPNTSIIIGKSLKED